MGSNISLELHRYMVTANSTFYMLYSFVLLTKKLYRMGSNRSLKKIMVTNYEYFFFSSEIVTFLDSQD
jgi:hypothetical protein